MPRGPLPSEKTRRRNAATIPTTELPASGRKGRPPKPPEGYNFAEGAAAWWRWAWGTPQACAWSPGDLYVIARRASLEDDLAVQDRPFESSDFAELMGRDEDEVTRELEFVVSRLAAMAGGRNPILKEMRELDKILGLTPKGMADLRWKIVDDSGESEKAPQKSKAAGGSRRGRLSLVKTA